MRTSRIVSVVLAPVLAVALAAPAAAADHDIVLPAGTACEGFDLGIDLGLPRTDNSVYRQWFDADGNVVRELQAGTGYAMTFTNLSTGAETTFRSSGAVIHTSYGPDGSVTESRTGHGFVHLFPGDPGGPAMTVFLGGHTIFTMDSDFVTTVQAASGHRVDVCAALS